MKKKTKVYISGAVTGNPDYRKQFSVAERLLNSRGYKAVNPVKGEKEGKPWEWYMRRDIQKLVKCDAICLLEGWSDSAGANLESHIAEKLDMDIMFEEEFRNDYLRGFQSGYAKAKAEAKEEIDRLRNELNDSN